MNMREKRVFLAGALAATEYLVREFEQPKDPEDMLVLTEYVIQEVTKALRDLETDRLMKLTELV